MVKHFEACVWSVLPTNDRIYIGLETVSGFSNNLNILSDKGWKSRYITIPWDVAIYYYHSSKAASVFDIAQLGPKFGNRVVIGGYEKVFCDTHDNQLISLEEFERNKIKAIDNIVYNDRSDLFLGVLYDDSTHGLVRVVYEDSKFKFGEEVLHYDIKHDFPYRIHFLGKDNSGNPLFLSTVYLDHLVINNKRIADSHVICKGCEWRPLVVINNNFGNRKVDVLVSGSNVGGVVYMKSNYENPKRPRVIERKEVITGLSYDVYSLGVVRSEELHNMLLSLKGKS